MKCVLVLCMLAVVVMARPDKTYDSRYDSFNAQELVENVRLLKAYGNCFLSKGPCTPEGSDFKRIIPEALKDTCAKCTPKQKELIRTVVKGFQAKLPAVWQQLIEKEDPEKKYEKSFNEFINAQS